MIKIYCLEDINDLKYVGSTKQTLEKRKSQHTEKRKDCSSNKLHLEYSIIYLLEECDDENRKEREAYWINKLDCVNQNKLISHKRKYKDREEYCINYQKKNREKINQRQRERRNKNKDIVNKKNNEYYHKNKNELNKRRREKYKREK